MLRRMFKAFRNYICAPVSRSSDELGDEITEELAFHLSERTWEYVEQGMTEGEARRVALAKFGNVSRVASDCHNASIRGLVVWHRLHLTTTTILAVIVALLCMRSMQKPDIESQVPTAIATMLDNDWSGDISGRVLDERHRPIENADLLIVVKTWPDRSYFQRAYNAVSDTDGRFRLERVYPVNERYEVLITAVARNHVMKATYFGEGAGLLEPVLLELPQSSRFALQIETADGLPLTGVRVLPQGRVELGGAEHVIYFDSAQPLMSETDLNGRIELSYFLPGETASVLIQTSNSGWQAHKVVVPENGEIAKVRIPKAAETRSKES